MKPITEDQVVSLMKGFEKREKDALRRLAADVASGRFQAGRLTARVLHFTPNGQDCETCAESAGEVVSLAQARETSRARRTLRGIFVYSTDAPMPA